MTTIEQILGEFIDDWNAGKRPSVEDYLARAPDGDRDELASQLSTWLEIAPTPDFDEATRAAIAAEPALRAALETAATLRSPLAERLPALRARAGLALRDLASRISATFGIDDEKRAADYLGRLERDELDASRLSRRLLEALAGILGTDPDALVPHPSPLPAAAPALFRAEQPPAEQVSEDLDALSRAAMAPAPAAKPMDELDRLFLGGPDA